MSDLLNIKIKQEIGIRVKDLIEKNTADNALRKIDAATGKDHSWLGKLLKGKVNFTIDSLIEIAVVYKIELKDIFDFKIDFEKISDKELSDYLSAQEKRRNGRVKANKPIKKSKIINRKGNNLD